jgi:hypothetical protein
MRAAAAAAPPPPTPKPANAPYVSPPHKWKLVSKLKPWTEKQKKRIRWPAGPEGVPLAPFPFGNPQYKSGGAQNRVNGWVWAPAPPPPSVVIPATMMRAPSAAAGGGATGAAGAGAKLAPGAAPVKPAAAAALAPGAAKPAAAAPGAAAVKPPTAATPVAAAAPGAKPVGAASIRQQEEGGQPLSAVPSAALAPAPASSINKNLSKDEKKKLAAEEKRRKDEEAKLKKEEEKKRKEAESRRKKQEEEDKKKGGGKGKGGENAPTADSAAPAGPAAAGAVTVNPKTGGVSVASAAAGDGVKPAGFAPTNPAAGAAAGAATAPAKPAPAKPPPSPPPPPPPGAPAAAGKRDVPLPYNDPFNWPFKPFSSGVGQAQAYQQYNAPPRYSMTSLQSHVADHSVPLASGSSFLSNTGGPLNGPQAYNGDVNVPLDYPQTNIVASAQRGVIVDSINSAYFSCPAQVARLGLGPCASAIPAIQGFADGVANAECRVVGLAVKAAAGSIIPQCCPSMRLFIQSGCACDAATIALSNGFGITGNMMVATVRAGQMSYCSNATFGGPIESPCGNIKTCKSYGAYNNFVANRSPPPPAGFLAAGTPGNVKTPAPGAPAAPGAAKPAAPAAPGAAKPASAAAAVRPPGAAAVAAAAPGTAAATTIPQIAPAPVSAAAVPGAGSKPGGVSIASIASAPSPSSDEDEDDDDDEEEEEEEAKAPSPAGAAARAPSDSAASSASAPSISPKEAMKMVEQASRDPGVEAAAEEIAAGGPDAGRTRLPRLPRPGDPLPPLQKGQGLVYSSVG